MAGLTVKRLTRAARAHVATAARRTACLHVSRAMQAARRRAVLVLRAGSAGGPKPGRAGFYLELGGRTHITEVAKTQIGKFSGLCQHLNSHPIDCHPE